MDKHIMDKLYKWFIIILFIIIFGWVIVSNIRYNNLKDDYEQLLHKDTQVIDSLKRDNEIKAFEIKNLESDILELNAITDSLKNLKVEIYEDTYKVSTSISEGVLLLKENLKCVELP